MKKRTYKDFKKRKFNDCNIKIRDYNVSYVINKIAKEKNISKSKLIENLIYKEYSSYFHNIPESLESIIDNMKRNLESNFFEEPNVINYYIKRLENLKEVE